MNAPIRDAQVNVSSEVKLVASLLDIESEIRFAENSEALAIVVANAACEFFSADLCFVFRPGVNYSRPQMVAASHLPQIDRTTPSVFWYERLVKIFRRHEMAGKPYQIQKANLPAELHADWEQYCSGNLLWLPLKVGKRPLQGWLLLSRKAPWQDAEKVLSEHLCASIGHAFWAFRRPGLNKVSTSRKKLLTGIVSGLIVAAMLLPVRLSALAQAEVSPTLPALVTSPQDGVVEKLLVQTNDNVAQGDILARLDGSALDDNVEIARRSLNVSQAVLHSARQKVFSDAATKAQIAELAAEVELRQAELKHAEKLAEQAVIRALKDGIAIAPEPEQIEGKPIRVGERILMIANPANVELLAYLPVKDAIALEEGAEVELFLDVSPLEPIKARVTRSAFAPDLTPEQVLAYTVRADFTELESVPRIGLRGTARVYGEQVSLFYYLFRRPITATRQWLGI